MKDAIGKNLEVFVTKTEAQATASDFVAAHPAALCISSDTKSIVFGGQVLTLGDHQAKVNKWVDEKRVLKLNSMEAVGSATINSTTTSATSTDQLIWATDKKAVYLKRDGQYYNNWTECKVASMAFIFGSDYCQNITASGCLAVIGVDLYLISKFSDHIQLTSASGDVADGSLTESKLSQELAEKINAKQDKLTLEVLTNGNIKIGNLNGQTKEFMPATPSGDPMHYAYEAMGAVYNSGEDVIAQTPWASLVDDADYNAKWGLNLIPDNATKVKTLKYNGVDRDVYEMKHPAKPRLQIWVVADKASDGTKICDDTLVVKRSGMWYFLGFGDLTNAQMNDIFRYGHPSIAKGAGALSKGRVIQIYDGLSNSSLPDYYAYYNDYAEVLQIGLYPALTGTAYNFRYIKYIKHGDYLNSNLGIKTTLLPAPYLSCGILLFAKTATLSIERISAKSMIKSLQLSNPTTEITLTFPSALYDRLMDTNTTLGAELVALLESKSNISFARGE